MGIIFGEEGLNDFGSVSVKVIRVVTDLPPPMAKVKWMESLIDGMWVASGEMEYC